MGRGRGGVAALTMAGAGVSTLPALRATSPIKGEEGAAQPAIFRASTAAGRW